MILENCLQILEGKVKNLVKSRKDTASDGTKQYYSQEVSRKSSASLLVYFIPQVWIRVASKNDFADTARRLSE